MSTTYVVFVLSMYMAGITVIYVIGIAVSFCMTGVNVHDAVNAVVSI